MDPSVSQGRSAAEAAVLADIIDGVGLDALVERQAAAEAEILTMGISFTVYTDGDNVDRSWPYDVIPRIIDGARWDSPLVT